MKRLGAIVIAVAVTLAGCGTGTPPAGQLKDISGMMPDLEFDPLYSINVRSINNGGIYDMNGIFQTTP